MALTHNHQGWDKLPAHVTFTCNSCPNVYVTSTNKFKEGWEEIKALGWGAVKQDEKKWIHLCPECYNTRPRVVRFECEDCGQSLALKATDFKEAIKQLKALGWMNENYNDKWVQICPQCQDEMPKDIA